MTTWQEKCKTLRAGLGVSCMSDFLFLKDGALVLHEKMIDCSYGMHTRVRRASFSEVRRILRSPWWS